MFPEGMAVTFDEHGGTFDHVPPPTNAVDPDALDPPYVFGRYGVRVPTLLVSPCVPAGAVFRAGYYPEAPGSQEVGEAFRDLRRRYGSLPRDGVRSR